MAVDGGSGGTSGSIRAGRAHVEMSAKDAGLNSALDRIQRRMLAVGKVAAKFGAALAIAFGAAAVASFKSAVNSLDKIADAAARLGTSAETISALGFAAEQSGASFEELEQSAKIMQRTLVTAPDAFAAIGLEAENIKKLDLPEQFAAIADAISAIEDPAEQTATALSIFGKGGASMLPLLKEGGPGIRALIGRAGQVGAIVKSEDARNAKRLADAMDEVWTAVKGVVRTFGLLFVNDKTETMLKFAVLLLGRMREWIEAGGFFINRILPGMGQAWENFRNAVEAGNLNLALEGIEAQLELGWANTVATMTEVWNDFANEIVDGWHSAMHEIRLLWIDFAAFLKKTTFEAAAEAFDILGKGDQAATARMIADQTEMERQSDRLAEKMEFGIEQKRRDAERAANLADKLNDVAKAQEHLNDVSRRSTAANATNPVLGVAFGFAQEIFRGIAAMNRPHFSGGTAAGQFGGANLAATLGIGPITQPLNQIEKNTKRAADDLGEIKRNGAGLPVG